MAHEYSGDSKAAAVEAPHSARACNSFFGQRHPQDSKSPSSSSVNDIRRMRYLMDIGLSKEEVSSMVSRFSPLLGYSIEAVFKPKLDFLLTTMQKPLKEIVQYPRYFSYSLDKKIKPRFWVLKSRNITCSLKDMLGKNNEEFAEEFMGIGRLLVPPAPVPPKEDQ